MKYVGLGVTGITGMMLQLYAVHDYFKHAGGRDIFFC
jgi:hypothetical protein